MRLYRIDAYTGSTGLKMMQAPDPAPPVARQVVVRVRATSINFRDLIDLQGVLATHYGAPSGRIPMCDGVGEVVAVGPEVRRVKPGDRVAAIFHGSWIGGPPPLGMNILGRGAEVNDGMLAEYSTVDESELVHLPEHLSYEEAAALPCAGVTAWYSLFGPATLMPGDTVLLQGTGGVSVLALQFARTVNAKVIVTTTSPDKAEALRALGASEVIDARKGQDWVSAVRELTGGHGVDWSINIAGGDTVESMVKATRPGGRMVLVGFREGAMDKLSSNFMVRGLNIHVTRVGSREHFEQMNRAISAAKIRPVIDRVFDFAEAPAAFDYFAQAAHVGKVVIRC